MPHASTTQLPDVQEKRHEIQMQHCYKSVHTSLISSSPPHRLDVAVRPGSCYTCSLAQASLRRQDDRHYWWSQRVICLCRANYSATLACPLQSANAFSLWVLSQQVWMQLQLEHRFWKNVTGARFWKRVPDNRILLNNLNRQRKQQNGPMDQKTIYIRKEQDKSMNRDEGSYQLSHIYDKLFAAAATYSGERKLTTSFQKRQQLLAKGQQ